MWKTGPARPHACGPGTSMTALLGAAMPAVCETSRAGALRASAFALVLALAAVASGCADHRGAGPVAQGDAQRGRQLIERYGCVACHSVPGVPSYGANVGPPLAKLAERGYLAGVLPNTREELVRWLRDPPAVDPLTMMPNLGVTQADAVDIAAYLHASP